MWITNRQFIPLYRQEVFGGRIGLVEVYLKQRKDKGFVFVGGIKGTFEYDVEADTFEDCINEVYKLIKEKTGWVFESRLPFIGGTNESNQLERQI